MCSTTAASSTRARRASLPPTRRACSRSPAPAPRSGRRSSCYSTSDRMNEQQRATDKTNEHVDFARRTLLMLPIISGLPTTLAGQAMAATSSNLAARALPPRTLPVPEKVSPALQAVIAAPYPVGWDVIPQTTAEWNELASLSAAAAAPFIAEIYR